MTKRWRRGAAILVGLVLLGSSIPAEAQAPEAPSTTTAAQVQLGMAQGDAAGYWLFAADGGIFSFGDAPFYGSGVGDCHWEDPLGWCLDGEVHPSGDGYWLMNGAICRVLNFGVAGHFGDRWESGNQPRDDYASCGGFASTPSGDGYWTASHLGTVLPWGAANFYGDVAHLPTQLIIGFEPTQSGRGYWLLGEDGGVFSFGDARFFGSTGGVRLNQPIVGMARTPSGNGYWLVARDGGIFSFGDARFFGSTGNIRLNQPVNGMAPTPSGNGYWLIADDGGIFAFGDAPFFGSTGGQRLNEPVLGIMPRLR